MNEPSKSVDQVIPPQGRATVWWRVRPVLQVALVAEALAIVALLTLDATSAAIVRSWFRSVTMIADQVTVEQVQAVITPLAIVSVIAVVVEGLRRGRLSPRRNGEGLKVASA